MHNTFLDAFLRPSMHLGYGAQQGSGARHLRSLRGRVQRVRGVRAALRRGPDDAPRQGRGARRDAHPRLDRRGPGGSRCVGSVWLNAFLKIVFFVSGGRALCTAAITSDQRSVASWHFRTEGLHQKCVRTRGPVCCPASRPTLRRVKTGRTSSSAYPSGSGNPAPYFEAATAVEIST